MKTTTTPLLLAASALLSCTAVSRATTVISGDQLVIGTHPAHPAGASLGTGSGSLGYDNEVYTNYSLAIGTGNVIDFADNERSSFALGENNLLVGYYSLVGGAYNEVWDSGSITSGYYNYNNAPCSLMVGTGNTAENAANDNGIIAGKYNSPISLNKPAHLVIGNGTNANDRANSFIVYANGDVVITKTQGDISMGIYGD